MQDSVCISCEESLMSPDSVQRIAEAAEMYWVHGMTVEEVGRNLHVSRSTVSRLLARARTEGIIQFSVSQDQNRSGHLGRQLDSCYGVRSHVVATPEGVSSGERLEVVAEAAARLLNRMLGSDMTLTVAWGATVEAVSKHLDIRPVRGLRIVQFNGSGNMATSGIEYAGTLLQRFGQATGGTIHYFPVPAFFDSVDTKRCMWQERSVRRILGMRKKADILLSSIGTFSSELPGHLYRAAYLDRADLEELRAENVVGDLGATFFRGDGSTEGITCNERSTGMTFAELRRIRTRLLVVADPRKAAALRAVLKAGVVTDLLVDAQTAAAVLA